MGHTAFHYVHTQASGTEHLQSISKETQMSTSPATPTITAAVQSEVAALANRHIGLIFGLVGTIILMVGLMGVGGYFGLKAFDAQLSRQEVRDAQYQTDRTTFLNTLAAHDAERTADATKIAQLEAQIKARDSKPLPPAVKPGMQPNASAEQVKNALGAVYGVDVAAGTPKVEPDGNIALSPSQGQQALSARLDADRYGADLKDEKAINSLQETTIGSLKTDLNTCKDLNTKAQADIAGYKKLAKKSRWQKFLAGAEKVGLLAGGAMLGHII